MFEDMGGTAGFTPSVAWLSPARRRSDRAKRVVEFETVRLWSEDTPNPLDPRKGLGAAMARCEPLVDVYGEKARRVGGTGLAEHVERHLPEIVSAILDDHRRVVESSLYCAHPKKAPRAAHHCASGFQMQIELSPDGAFVEKVNAKPYNLAYLCCKRWKRPRGEGNFWWRRHMFLGVGERLYRHVDEAVGGRRWAMRTTSPHADLLRRKLHCAYPFKWEDRYCRTCEAAEVEWRTTAPGAFPAHHWAV